jgi:hypothetical protein
MWPVCEFAGILSIVYYWLDCGFTKSKGSIISYISYGVFTKSIIISLVEFIEFLSSVSVLSFLGTAHFYSICYLCFRGWCRFLGHCLHHSYQTARWVLRPWLCLAFLVLKFLLLLFDFHGAQQEGKVLQMYMMLQVWYTVTAAGADASCIYLESFTFSLLYTIEYMHTVLPHFHIVKWIYACSRYEGCPLNALNCQLCFNEHVSWRKIALYN